MGSAIVTTDVEATSSSGEPRRGRPAVSVIVPLFNEQESVRPLYAAIVQAVGQLGRPFEMVFVDDGSTDETVAIVTEIARRFPEAKVENVRFIGPDVPSWKWGPRAVPGRGPRDTYG